MADYDETEDQQPGGAPSPLLQQFRGLFTHPAAQKWADEAVTILNHGFQTRRLAQQNLAAGQNFVNDLDQFKSGLVSMVKNDPLMVHTALDLVHPTLGAVIGSMPGAPEDADDHHAALTAHMEHDIAHAAVLSAAERNENVARNLLASDRISGALGDSTAGLNTYIDQQAAARATDAKAQADAAAQMRDDLASSTAINYLGALYHAPTGRLQFPPGWNQAVTADLKLPPAAKLTVQGVYSRLQGQGDVAESNPFVVSDFLKQMATDEPPHPADILSHAGGELRLDDALHLAGMAQSGPVKASPVALANALRVGETTLAAPENGPPGESAFSRFTNWLMSAVRNGGNLDPAAPDYVLKGNRLQNFAPSATEMVDAGVINTTPGGNWWYRQGGAEPSATFGGSVRPDPFTPTHDRPTNDNPAVQIAPRPSLSEILTGQFKVAGNASPGFDEKARRMEDLRLENTGVIPGNPTESGSFFQNLIRNPEDKSVPITPQAES